MTSYYQPPLEDIRFVLEALGYTERIASIKDFEDYDIETAMSIAKTTADIGVKEILPLNKLGDQDGLQFDPETGDVKTPKGFPAAYKILVDNGLIGLNGAPEYGGSGAPEPLGLAFSEIMISSNKSFSMCPGLSRGLIEAIEAFGTDEQKEIYLSKLISGEWSGTMCLTEPQCGTDLGLMTTKAVPNDDGSYNLTGAKIWITFGEHDMAENIVHLVLARLPDAPEGIKGVSTFIVPKFLPDGTRNHIKCSALEHKMGIIASPTCEMVMDNAKGWLVGQPNKGMRSMFVMMNAARLHVGLEGVGLSEVAYQTSLAFCKDRRQGRSLNPERNDPNASADCIMVHPDVRRLLLNQKSTTEALRAMCIYIGMELAISRHHPDEDQRQVAKDLVDLLVPICKSYGTERGFLNTSDAMQVCGGAGFTTDWNIEQYMRDMRIAMIYEGTNHIQALDLVGRKLGLHGGRLVITYQQLVASLVESMQESEHKDIYQPYIDSFNKGVGRLTNAMMALMERGSSEPEWVCSIASNFLNLFALVVLGHMWLQMIQFAVETDHKLKSAKLKTAKFFFEFIYPETSYFAKLCQVDADTLMSLDVDEF